MKADCPGSALETLPVAAENVVIFAGIAAPPMNLLGPALGYTLASSSAPGIDGVGHVFGDGEVEVYGRPAMRTPEQTAAAMIGKAVPCVPSR